MQRSSFIALALMTCLAAGQASAEPVTFHDPTLKLGFTYDSQRWREIKSPDPKTVLAIAWKSRHDKPIGGCALQLVAMSPNASQIKKPLANYQEEITSRLLKNPWIARR